MSETDEFLEATMARLHDADTALHNGDAGPRKTMWAHTDPVSLFGAAISGAGWEEIEPVFDRLQATFSNGTFQNEVVAAGASGDLHTRSLSSTAPSP